MAVKTKADLQKELAATQAKLDFLEKEKKEFPDKLREALRSSIEKHGLDLCDSGISEFTEKLGVEWETIHDDFSATIYLNDVNVPVSGRYEEIDENFYINYERAVKKALQPVLDEFGGSFTEVYLER